MHDNLEELTRETAILACVDTGKYDIESSLLELSELADTAQIDILGVVTQKRESLDVATALGSGRVEELALMVTHTNAQMIIFDHDLTPAQLRNIEKLCDCPVLDRTMLILNIFASRAVTSEGKLQVDLAQLKYQLPRLSGRGVTLSRQGGGGAGGGGARRGAGETKLETDRRHIRTKISALETSLKDLELRRSRHRAKRKKDEVTTVAIVGYTNVGKSTLLNHLTQAGVLAEDKLFATLDPTSRALTLPDGRQVLLIDTVGFVRRLPHNLIEAFKSTLEEAVSADLILNICDITNPEMQEQAEVTQTLLSELGATDTPILTVLNKCDMLDQGDLSEITNSADSTQVLISAVTGKGIDTLLQAIQVALPNTHVRMKLLIPYTDAHIENTLSKNSKVFHREYLEDGLLLDINVDKTQFHIAKPFLTEKA